jgi:hypothetical protein
MILRYWIQLQLLCFGFPEKDGLEAAYLLLTCIINRILEFKH